MSIYDETKSMSMPKFSFRFEKLKLPIIGVILILVIAFLIVSGSSLFEPDPLLISFENNAFDLSEKKSLVMTVVIFNVLQEDAVDSVLTISPVDKDSVSIFPSEVTVPVLGKGESRKFDFNLRPVFEEIPSGNYEIEIKLVSNENTFSKRTSIYIKNN